MNVLMLSLMYPEDMKTQVAHDAKDKLQNQINSYQRAFVEGIKSNLLPDERLEIVNALPVGVFPLQYRRSLIPSGWHDEHVMYELGCINLPGMKQYGRARRAARKLSAWCAQDPSNRMVLLYTMYLPYLQAVERVRRRYPDLKACVIVTDLPNELGLASGRKGLLRQIEYKRGRRSMELCRKMDAFVLLTRPMADALGVNGKPCLVIEGLIQHGENITLPAKGAGESGRLSVLYSGTLEPDLGIPELLEAFASLPEYDLWICGQGSMSAEVAQAAKSHANIRYFGFVSHERALELQAKAALLINPRSPKGVFTRYSFPSKTLEYMRSGKPVVCHRLEGIPEEYDPYLQYIEGEGAGAIAHAVRKALALTPEERLSLGQRARMFVLDNKTPGNQCRRLMDFLRSL